MFEMDSFERELDEQNAALEAMLAELDSFENSSEDSLLDKVQAQVDAKCTTMEACESMLDKLNNEIREYNEALRTMKAAAESFGIDNDKVALKAAIAPASDMIRQKYSMITMEAASTEGVVSDNEVMSVRDFLMGSRAILDAKMASFATESYTNDDDTTSDPVDDTPVEGSSSVIESFMDSVDNQDDIQYDPVMESLKSIKQSVINFFQGLISKFTKKEKTEKDPKKKGMISKFISFIKGLFKKAEAVKEDDEDAAEQFERMSDEARKRHEEIMEYLEDTKVEESFIEEQMMDLAFEAYYTAVENRDIEMSAMECELYTDEYTLATEAYYDALASDNMEIATEAFDKMKFHLAQFCENMANKCFTKASNMKIKVKAKGVKKKDSAVMKMSAEDIEKAGDLAGIPGKLKALGNWFRTTAATLRSEISEEKYNQIQFEVDKKKSEYDGIAALVPVQGTGKMKGKLGAGKAKRAFASFIDDEYTSDDLAIESFDEFIDIVTESLNSVERKRIFMMKFGESKKAINATIKEAKSAAREGDYAKAISLYKKAKSGFIKLKSIATKLPDHKVNQTSFVSLKTETTEVSSSNKNNAINWVNAQISKCDLAIEKLQNKMAKTKRKADAKAAKDAAKAAKESYTEDEILSELDMAIESLTEVDELNVDDLDEILESNTLDEE